MYIQAVCLIDQLISRLSQELLNTVYNGALGTAPQSDRMLITKEQISCLFTVQGVQGAAFCLQNQVLQQAVVDSV